MSVPDGEARFDPAFSDVLAGALDRLEVEGPASLDEVFRTYPEWADAIRVRIAVLAESGLLRLEASDSWLPDRLGDFRLLKRLGSGGMGVVYLADQEGLNRRVALKVIRPDLVFVDGARDRFRREVDATSRLEHPGIVQFHAVGEAFGLPFVAMEFVDGCSLAQASTLLSGRSPHRLTAGDLFDAIQTSTRREGESTEARERLFSGSYVDACARIVRHVAEAVQHAHGRGVLHRDIKPSNVMVTPEGRVLLIDFGIAALVESSRLAGVASQVGSLGYMAPEQLLGAPVDFRADIYSLGVMLYELLTLRLPFGGTSQAETREGVLQGDPVSVRVLNPAVSLDLAAVCAVAMDRNPARRYPSATAMALDLARVLSHRPIVAKPVGRWLRMWRWSQRHPASTVAIVMGGVMMVGSLLFGVQQRTAHMTTLAARAETERARALSEEDYLRARRAIDRMLAELAGSYSLPEDGGPPSDLVRQRVIEIALSYFMQSLAQCEQDPRRRAEVALCERDVGELMWQLGRREEGLDHLHRAVRLANDLLRARPNDVESLALRNDVVARVASLRSLGAPSTVLVE